MHEVPRVFLLLDRWFRRKVSRHAVKERPGPATQLHPVRRTLVVLRIILGDLLTTHSLASRARDILHEGLEVGTGPAGTAIHLLCCHQGCLSLLRSRLQSMLVVVSVMKY